MLSVNRTGPMAATVLLIGVASACADSAASLGHDLDGGGQAGSVNGSNGANEGQGGSAGPDACAADEVPFVVYAIDVGNNCIFSDSEVLGCAPAVDGFHYSSSWHCVERSSDGARFSTPVSAPLPRSDGGWSECDTRPYQNCDFADCVLGSPSRCSRDATCKIVGCGTSQDWADADGCMRKPCDADGDCESDEKCTMVDGTDLQPPWVNCDPDEQTGECQCMNVLSDGVGPGPVCVPR